MGDLPGPVGGPDSRGVNNDHRRPRPHTGRWSPALKFVLLVGVMSFFADFTYEGSRSIIGQYLGLLGAGALAIATITGFGELLGYGLRLVSGRGADRTGLYWPITIGGYILQMSVVPLLALAGSWQVAAVLEVAVVGDRDDSARVLGEMLFEPGHAFDVEMVGGLVQQQRVAPCDRLGVRAVRERAGSFPGPGRPADRESGAVPPAPGTAARTSAADALRR
jgi:hypothetical protein